MIWNSGRKKNNPPLFAEVEDSLGYIADGGDTETSPIRSQPSPPPTAAQAESRPVLQNYITDAEGGANLWKLIEHPYILKAEPFIVHTASGPEAYGPLGRGLGRRSTTTTTTAAATT